MPSRGVRSFLLLYESNSICATRNYIILLKSCLPVCPPWPEWLAECAVITIETRNTVISSISCSPTISLLLDNDKVFPTRVIVISALFLSIGVNLKTMWLLMLSLLICMVFTVLNSFLINFSKNSVSLWCRRCNTVSSYVMFQQDLPWEVCTLLLQSKTQNEKCTSKVCSF